jgi:sigma-E factor negative regulatory protein RseC
MMNKISHTGIIETIKDECITVRILQTSACASCKVAGHCSASESKEKIVEVRDKKAAVRHKEGDSVIVAMSTQNGREAVLIAFAIPLVLMLVVLIGMRQLTENEGVMALVAVLSLVPYYFAVYLFRRKLAGKFAFVIEN